MTTLHDPQDAPEHHGLANVARRTTAAGSRAPSSCWSPRSRSGAPARGRPTRWRRAPPPPGARWRSMRPPRSRPASASSPCAGSAAPIASRRPECWHSTKSARRGLGSLVEGVVVRTLAEVGDRVRPDQGARGDGQPTSSRTPGPTTARRSPTAAGARPSSPTRGSPRSAPAGCSPRRRSRARSCSGQRPTTSTPRPSTRWHSPRSVGRGGARAPRRHERRGPHRGERRVHPGEEPFCAGSSFAKTVTQGTAVTPGTPLFVVADLSELWASAEIDEKDVPRVTPGRPVELRSPRIRTRPLPAASRSWPTW